MEDGQPAAEPSIDDLAANIATGILKSESPEAQEEPAKPEKEAEEPKAEESAEQEVEEQSQPEVRKHKLTVKSEDGSDLEVEVDDEELKKGYMLEKSYRQKTAQLARQREEMQRQIKEAIDPKLQEYDQKLQLAEQVVWNTLFPDLQKTDWNKLAEENPAEWAKKYQQVENVKSKLAQIAAERQKIAQMKAQEVQESQKKAIQQSVETLRERIQGWNDDLYSKVLKGAVENYGFKPEEVQAIIDPRAIEVLNDARQWREFKSAKPTVEKRVPPPAPKVVKPGTTEKPDTGDKWKEGMAQLRKTGKDADALVLAKMLLAREAKQK